MRWIVFVLLLVGCNSRESQRAAGRQVFAGNCARCHGNDGGGGPPLSDGGPAPRNLRDGAWQKTVTDQQLRQIITRGKLPNMPAFEQALTAEQLELVIQYVRTLPGDKP